ncbi:MAG TPA: pyruvate kinase [Vitreimonas sp.]|nr:pyruvate kinase [Vitreimonas sp.]
MKKLTKIVATIGPATEAETIMADMIHAGMNVARFNTKHSDPQWHNQFIQQIKKVANDLHQPVGVLLDLQGPEVRIDLPGEPFAVAKGDSVTFTSDRTVQGDKIVWVPEDVVRSLQPGNSILLEDGACEFSVISHTENALICKAEIECTVKTRKTMNTPGVVLSMPSLTDRDYQFLDHVDLNNVDFVGLSFVRNKEDVAILRSELEKRNSQADIVAKIENQQALDNIDELIQVSDAVMVARGDLGVEVPFQELTYWQRLIIDKCRVASKPVITATEMLKSMIEKPRPTRAEVSDVAHAIYDGTDAIMLSDETTIGKYPLKAVAAQTAIAEFNEQHTKCSIEVGKSIDSTAAIAQAASDIIENSNIPLDKIICLTETGRTARLIARFHPLIPIYTLTHSTSVAQKLTLSYGVSPLFIDPSQPEIQTEEGLLQQCKEMKIVDSGDQILLIRGKFWRQSGLTNTVSIITIP